MKSFSGWLPAGIVLAALGAGLPAGVAAQAPSTGSGHAYPAKPVRLISPYPPGGTDAVGDPKVAQTLTNLGLQPVSNAPDEFCARVRLEIEKWGKVIKAAGIKGE